MSAIKGDRVKASISIRLPQQQTFDLFTAQIENWWKRGPRYRNSGATVGLIHIEPKLDGRLFESWSEGNAERAFEIGRVTQWEPHQAFAFTWRNSNFNNDEVTLVELNFEDCGETTMITVIHSGWAAIREDHPARHGLSVVAFQQLIGMWWGDQLTSLRRVSLSDQH